MTILWMSLIVVILKLLYDIHLLSITNIQITDPKFVLLDPDNPQQSELVDDIYDKLVDLNNFTFIQKPELCLNSTALLLVIIISSYPMNYERRTTIRNTWGRSDDSTKVVFLVGESNDTIISRDVENESTIFRDIVQGNFFDVYRNNTYKHVMGLKWVCHHCPMAKYVLKVNDNVFVQTYALRHFLARELSPWGAKSLIICRIRKYVVPQRFHGLPNRVSSKEYPEWYYPPHCLGLVILYSHDVVSLLLKAAQSAPYFWVEDVHLTGILTKKMELKLTSANSLIPRPWHWDFKSTKFLFGYLNMSMSDMKLVLEQALTTMKMPVHQMSLVVVSLKLLYDFYDTTVTKVRVEDPEFILLDPFTSTEVKPINDVYDILINIKNFTFINNPDLCRNAESILLVVIIASNPLNYDRRTAIRDTWGRSDASTKVVFLMGEPNNMAISGYIEREKTVFRDIVQGNFLDAYRNNTYKHAMGLKWVAHHCPMAKYVLKTDDDVFVHIKALKHFLTRDLSPWGAKKLIMCHIFKSAVPQRSFSYKWRVLPEEYSEKVYPPYCLGFVILYSQDVITRLLEAAQAVPYFWIDDVHLTGIITKRIKLELTSAISFILKPWQKDYKTRKFLFGRCDISIEEIKSIWNAISSDA